MTHVVLPIPERHSSTPILDLIAPLPDLKVGGFDPRQVTLIVILVAIGLVHPLSLGTLILGYFAIGFAVIAIHETGHLLAGCSVGLRLEYLMIGPFCVRRSPDRWKMKMSHFSGGLIQMSIDDVYRVRRRLLYYFAGGPVASLLTGLVALYVCRNEQIGGNPVLGIPLAVYAIWSLLIAIQSLRSIQIGSYSSDGMLLRSLSGSYECALQQIAAHALQMLKNRGVDRSLWNRRWVRLAATPTQILRTTYFEDWRQYEEATDPVTAAECLERCLGGIATLSLFDREDAIDELFLEAATFTAWHFRDATKAALWFQRVIHPENARILTRVKAEMALHCVKGQFDSALAEWHKGFEFIQRLPAGYRTDETKSEWLGLKVGLDERRMEYITSTQQHSLSATLMKSPLPPTV